MNTHQEDAQRERRLLEAFYEGLALALDGADNRIRTCLHEAGHMGKSHFDPGFPDEFMISELLAEEQGETVFHGPQEDTLTLEQLISRLEEKVAVYQAEGHFCGGPLREETGHQEAMELAQTIAQMQAVGALLQPTDEQIEQLVTQLMLAAEETARFMIEQRAYDFELIVIELFARNKLKPKDLNDQFGPPANAEGDEEEEEEDEQMDVVQNDEWED
ncbi:hypothetical protein niasHS_002082 [Heterodera schachtii]|uniref:Uncharacterized protein n=1 Tax=Heterodera schachtii TaxID=97005 RepID=A0ABD2K5U0_HETSC